MAVWFIGKIRPGRWRQTTIMVCRLHLVITINREISSRVATMLEQSLAFRVLSIGGGAAAESWYYPEEVCSDSKCSTNPNDGEENDVDFSLDSIELSSSFHGTNRDGGHDSGENG